MKKYLIFCYGNFNIFNKSKINTILNDLAEITSSQFIRYKSENNSVVFHFGTDLKFKGLKSAVNEIMSKSTDYHFLIEYNDNMSLNFGNDEDTADFLKINNYELDEETEKILDELTEDLAKDLLEYCRNEKNNMDFISDMDEDCDELIKKSSKKEYNLDDILDKINEKGISSLTKEETNYLKNIKQ